MGQILKCSVASCFHWKVWSILSLSGWVRCNVRDWPVLLNPLAPFCTVSGTNCCVTHYLSQIKVAKLLQTIACIIQKRHSSVPGAIQFDITKMWEMGNGKITCCSWSQHSLMISFMFNPFSTLMGPFCVSPYSGMYQLWPPQLACHL